MGILDTPWVTPQSGAEAAPDSSFVQGLRSGWTGMKGQVAAAAGAGAEGLGYTDLASDMYGRSQELAAQASREAPAVRSYTQVDGLRSGFDYVTGQIGAAIPSMAAGVGGALLMRRAPTLGAGAALAVPETGDMVQRQLAAGDTRSIGERNKEAMAGGLGSALIQGVVPGFVGKQILGKTAIAGRTGGDILARGGMAAAGEGAAEGGAEMFKQDMAGQERDWQAVKEGVVGGVAAGTAMAAPGAGAEYLHSRAADASSAVARGIEATKAGVAKAGEVASEAFQRGREGVKTASEASTNFAKKVSTDFSDLYGRATRRDSDMGRSLANDELVEPLKDGEDPKDAVKRSDKLATDYAAEWLKSKLADSSLSAEDRERYSKLVDRVADPAAKAEIGAQVVIERTRKEASEFYDHFTKGEGSKAVRAKLSGAQDAIRAYVDEFNSKSIGERIEGVKASAKRLMNDPDVRDDVKKRISEGLQNAGDRAYQTFITTAARAIEFKDAIRDGSLKMDDVAAIFKPATKKSEDFSGVRQIIQQEMIPYLKKYKPEVLNDEEAMTDYAEGIRVYLQKLRKIDRDNKKNKVSRDDNNMMLSLFGREAYDMMDRIDSAIHKGQLEEDESFYAALNDLRVMGGQDSNMAKVVKEALKDKKATVKHADLRSAVRMLRGYVDGTLMQGLGPSERTYRERQFRDTLEQEFGDKADSVLEAFEKEYAERGDEDFVTDEERAQDEIETQALEEKEVQRENVRVYPKDRKLILSHDAHRQAYGNENSQFMRLMKEAESENPDRQIEFVSAREHAEEQGWDEAKLSEFLRGKLDLADDVGYIVARGERDESFITASTAEKMKLDSRNYKTSKSRIDTEKAGVTLDALRITREMRKQSPRQSGESVVRHIIRSFYEGLGAVLDFHATKVKDLSDDTIIAYVNGDPMTLGEAKKARLRDPNASGENEGNSFMIQDRKYDDRTTRELRAEVVVQDEEMKQRVSKYIETLKKNKVKFDKETIKAFVNNEDNKPLNDEIKALRAEIEKREGEKVREEGSSDSWEEKKYADLGVEEIDPNANIHMVEKDRGVLDDREWGKPTKDTDDGLELSRDPSGMPLEDLRSLDKRPAGDNVKPELATDATPRVQGPLDIEPKLDADEVKPTVRKEKVEKSKHVEARAPSIEDDAKDIVVGATHAGMLVERYARKGPKEAQELVKALNKVKVKDKDSLRRANEAIYKLNASIAASLEGRPGKKYSLSLINGDENKDVSEPTRERVGKHIESVLGPKVDVAWADFLHAGEFESSQEIDHSVPEKDRIDPKLTIRISVHALDPMGTAFHESLHAFFFKLREMKQYEVVKVLYRAASSAPVMNQLRTLLKNEPEALKQVEASMEERVAYMYQFWAKEKLTLGPETKGVLSKVKDFIMKLLGMWTNDQRAEHIMEYFHTGEFAKHLGDRNAVFRATMEPGKNKHVEKLMRIVEPLKRAEMLVIGSGSARLRDTMNPALVKIADLIAPDKTDGKSDVGFIVASRSEHVRVMNELAKDLKDIDDEDIAAAHKALLLRTKADTVGAERARLAIRKHLDKLFEYMTEAGVDVKDRGYQRDYFPRVWDDEYISKHQDEFKAMLEKYKATHPDFNGDPEKIMQRIIANGGAEESIAIDRPGMQNLKKRELDFISDADAERYMSKNLFETMNRYVSQATRRAEWHRRFGETGVKDLLKQAEVEHGAHRSEIKAAKDYIHGVLGTLGDDLNPTYRRLFGNLIVFQNIRLLPMAIFSQAVDPMGIAVRGGTMGDAWKAAVRGFKEIPRGFKKDKAKDEWYELAETIGAIEDVTLMHAVGTSYTQGMVSNTARRINDTLFKYNMVEQMTISMRVAATEAATRFILRHGRGKYNEHSVRYLAELGLKPGDAKVMPQFNNRLAVTVEDFKALGQSDEQAMASFVQMKGALNTWIDGAVLRPNAAERPIWMNDPHYALVAHLKTFIFAFQSTILSRVWHELEHKNYAPALALMSYVPIMLFSDLAKGFIQGGGEQPEWKRGWTWKQYLGSATERAGLYGTGQFASDLMRDVKRGDTSLSVLGPTFEHGMDALKTVGGAMQYDTFIINSLPANVLYKETIRGRP
jgi:hypothetical protein